MADESGMMGRVTAKAGPLPVWGWVLIIGGGAYYYYKKKSASTAASTTTTATTTTPANGIDPTYTPALLSADYGLYNQLGMLNSQSATLATNVGANTVATQANTAAENATTANPGGNSQANINPPPATGGKFVPTGSRYAVVQYGQGIFELGNHSGTHLSGPQWAQLKKAGANDQTIRSQYARLPSGAIYKLGAGNPQHLSGPQYAAAGHPAVANVAADTTVNIAPSKVS